MPSDDLLSPSMFACTLDETGVDGYRPAALRLMEAHDAALREQVRVLRTALASLVASLGTLDCSGRYENIGRRYDEARAALAATEPEDPK